MPLCDRPLQGLNGREKGECGPVKGCRRQARGQSCGILPGYPGNECVILF